MEASSLEKTYEIKGMTCAACVSRVERVIQKIPQVQEVAVNLATERARVVFREEFSDEAIIAAIQKTGYEAKRFVEAKFGDLPETKEIELKAVRMRLILSAVFTIPLLWPMLNESIALHAQMNGWVQTFLAAVVQFGWGARFYRSSFFALRSRSPNMDVLVCLGTLAAFSLSIYSLLIHGPMQGHFYFETGAFITTLVMLGKYLESQAKSQTGAAVQKLKSLRPSTVRALRNGVEETISLSLVRKGFILRIRPGEIIPADGEVKNGRGEVNEALLTGESLPVLKMEGALVSGGSMNLDGALEIEVTHDASESLLSRMISLIEKAQEKKAPIQRLADQVSAVFVPIVLGLALLTLLLWGFITHDWEKALLHAVGVLVIACPCALGLATPTAIRVGMGIAAKKGILIRDAEVLETLHALTEIAFDKTGTLTQGNFTLSYLRPPEPALLQILASLQSQSEHPLAKAVLNAVSTQQLFFSTPKNLRTIPGEGVEAEVNGTSYFFGNEAAIRKRCGGSANMDFATTSSEKGETISYLLDLDSKKVLATAGFVDEIRADSRLAVQHLHASSIQTSLLSGDRKESADRVGHLTGIKEIHAPLTPEQKTDFIRSRIEKGIRIGMVGDGLNDGPALATASVGFALSTGTDVSMSVAGVTLMRPDLRLIPESIALSKRIYRKIKQNLFWAFAYNVLGIPLAALGYLNPMVAGAAMALSSVSVVLNSLSLRERT